MNVERVGAIVKISGCAVLPEKLSPIELETVSNARFELGCAGFTTYALQRAQVVSGVEVVNPAL
jgi:hypothetical protein